MGLYILLCYVCVQILCRDVVSSVKSLMNPVSLSHIFYLLYCISVVSRCYMTNLGEFNWEKYYGRPPLFILLIILKITIK